MAEHRLVLVLLYPLVYVFVCVCRGHHKWCSGIPEDPLQDSCSGYTLQCLEDHMEIEIGLIACKRCTLTIYLFPTYSFRCWEQAEPWTQCRTLFFFTILSSHLACLIGSISKTIDYSTQSKCFRNIWIVTGTYLGLWVCPMLVDAMGRWGWVMNSCSSWNLSIILEEETFDKSQPWSCLPTKSCLIGGNSAFLGPWYGMLSKENSGTQLRVLLKWCQKEV